VLQRGLLESAGEGIAAPAAEMKPLEIEVSRIDLGYL
jgi:hypothetical protein